LITTQSDLFKIDVKTFSHEEEKKPVAEVKAARKGP
jgi:hypothetical protein